VRVSTAFNRLLSIPETTVRSVSITDRQVEVVVRPNRRRLSCSCGHSTAASYDRRRRRWRHLDLGVKPLFLVYEVRRLHCPKCGVRTETVPWARPGARHTRDFEDTVLWLAQRTDRTTVSILLRCSWKTVTGIINRTVADMLAAVSRSCPTRIGIDEICYRHPHKYLTVIGDHDTGKVVHIEPGRDTQALTNFFTLQSDSERSAISVASMDGARAWHRTTEQWAPNARICLDPFHVIQWVNRALDRVFDSATAVRKELNLSAGNFRSVRTALRTGRERLNPNRRRLAAAARKADLDLATAWRLKEDLRDLYRLDLTKRGARIRLRHWIKRAQASKIGPMVNLANSLSKRETEVLAAIELNVSNALIEGINAKIRLINNRGYGHHSAQTLTSMIYLCCGPIEPKLPTRS